MKNLSSYDYIFYISPEGVEIENNGVRETDAEYRNLIDFTIRNFINVYNGRLQNCKQISGTTGQRIKQILETISL